MDGVCPPHCGHGIGKAPCSTSGGIYTLNTFEYMLHCHQKTYHLQGTSIASWCPPCQVRNELSVGLMWQVHPPKQIETVVAYGDLIHQIAQKNSCLSPSSPFRLPQNPNCMDKTMLRFIDHLHCTQYDPHSWSKSPCCWLNPIFCRWNPHVSRTFQDIPGPPPGTTSIIPPAAFTLKPLTGKSLHVARQWRGNGNGARIWSIINCGFEGFLSHWGTPKSSSLVGFSIINQPSMLIHFGDPPF